MRQRCGGGAPARRFGGSPANGGWFFAVNPDASPSDEPAVWRPSACALVAIAEPAPAGFAAARLGEMLRAAPIAAESICHREWHLVLLVAGRRYRLALRHCADDEALSYICPADIYAEARLALAAALHGVAKGRRPARPPPGADPGPTERWRLVQWLRLLDALGEGASTRDLAAALIDPDATSYSASAWDASSERRRIVRWRAAALAMRDGGYRALLAPD